MKKGPKLVKRDISPDLELPKYGKAKAKDPVSTIKKSSKPAKTEVFRISYKKPHSTFFTQNHIFQPRDFALFSDIEEYTLELTPYSRRYDFEYYSYLKQSNFMNELLDLYTKKHIELKQKKRTLKQQNTSEISQLDLTNLRIKKAIECVDSGLSRKTIAKMLGVKYKQLNHCLTKRKLGKIPELQKVGRPLKIRRDYLDFLRHFLQNPKNGLSSLYSLKLLLIRKFSIARDTLSLTTIYRMLKMINFSCKKCVRFCIQRNEPKTRADRYSLMQEIMKHRKFERQFIYIDETGFNNHIIPIFGYSPKGKRFPYKVSTKCPNISVLAAFTDEGIIAYQLIEKGVSAKDFVYDQFNTQI